MPVNCLTNAQKIMAVTLYQQPNQTLKSVSDHFDVVPSTIHKVLKEAGLTSEYNVKKRNQDQDILQFLKAKGIDYSTLKDIIALWNPEMFNTIHSGK